MTLRESLQTEITAGKAEVAKLESDLAKLETEASDFLSREVAVIKGWFEAVKAHL